MCYQIKDEIKTRKEEIREIKAEALREEIRLLSETKARKFRKELKQEKTKKQLSKVKLRKHRLQQEIEIKQIFETTLSEVNYEIKEALISTFSSQALLRKVHVNFDNNISKIIIGDKEITLSYTKNHSAKLQLYLKNSGRKEATKTFINVFKNVILQKLNLNYISDFTSQQGGLILMRTTYVLSYFGRLLMLLIYSVPLFDYLSSAKLNIHSVSIMDFPEKIIFGLSLSLINMLILGAAMVIGASINIKTNIYYRGIFFPAILIELAILASILISY